MGELSSREQTLVALGAAIGSNCLPCIEYHVPEARRAGCSDVEIHEAVQIADKVRRVPARAVLEAALARIERSAAGMAEPSRAGCGCAGSDEDVVA
jgi:4-carboxymuconolactone decarboxylase